MHLRTYLARLLLLLCLLPTLAMSQPTPTAQTARPWTYWWWMGSAVNETEITRQLEQMAQAGLGGVHVIPIYGVKGHEAEFIPFLSNRWLAVFSHTLREANRLGMGVDVTTGTGWPFGGPNVTPETAAKRWELVDGAMVTRLTEQRVKRAAPGAEGLEVDHFDQQAVRSYLTRFDTTLARLPLKPRAVYNDSYEVYGANWTAHFPAQFRQRRGYDFQTRLADFLDTTFAPGRASAGTLQVRRDYHETLSDLLHDAFTVTWTGWARQNGFLTRNQAHGSPGNLLDLYALADIPETESFGSSRFPIPGLRVDEEYPVDNFGTPHPLAMKFASSPAHLLGKPLVSAETSTWLADHFKVSLSQIKPQIDELFTAGINHIFYHGTTYSPASAGWPQTDAPGWLFYASTHYGPTSHNWPFLPLLNQYVTRCQTRLQRTRPDNDLLLYFPIHDMWANNPSRSSGGVHLLEVHHVDRWLLPQPFGQLADSLRRAGYAFDFISDRQLDGLRVEANGDLRARGGTYRTLALPPVTYLPERTRQRLAQLEAQGARIVYGASLPALSQQPLRVERWAAQGLSFIRKQTGDTTLYFIANLSNQFREGSVELSAKGAVTRYDPLTNQTERLWPFISRPELVNLRLLPGQSCFLTVVDDPTNRTVTYPPAVREAMLRKTRIELTDTLTNPWQVRFLGGRPALTSTHQLPNLRSWATLTDSAAYFWGKAHYTTTFDAPRSGRQFTPLRLNLGDVREVAEVRLNGQLLGTLWSLPYEIVLPAKLLKAKNNTLEVTVSNLSANYMRLRDGQQPDWKRFYDINMVNIQYKPFDATRWLPMPAGLLGPVVLTGSD